MYLHIYVITAVIITTEAQLNITHEQYVGCFADRDPRTMPKMGDGKKMELCVDSCRKNHETTFAAVSFDYECYCGEVYNTYGTSNNCYNYQLRRCFKQRDTVCGGGHGLSVYRVCLIGKYGSSCEQSCSNCGRHGCDMDGNCLDECPPGSQGQLCEQGCSPGTFGPSCSYNCTEGCLDDVCDARTGHCTEGCKPGLLGPFCHDKVEKNACQQYAYKPTGPCPFCSHCKDSVCVGDGGDCYKKCQKNWQGTHCKECNTGKWGSRCEYQCSKNCLDSSSCSMENGYCQGCAGGYHGAACNETCSENCVDQICGQNDGKCTEGCNNGFHGDQCIQTCPQNCSKSRCSRDTGECESCIDGSYGHFCNISCGKCVSKICNKESGVCDVCENGYHGFGCHQECPVNCINETCNKTNGLCDEGCSPGYFLPHCNATCPGCMSQCEQKTGYCIGGCNDGFNKGDCNTPCPSGCSVKCHQHNGTCIHGCRDGLYNFTCETTCPSNCHERCDFIWGACTDGCAVGFYGAYCNMTCPANCQSGCDQNGICVPDCIPGYYGTTCSSACEGCFEGICEQSDGSCMHGCNDGLQGKTCNEVEESSTTVMPIAVAIGLLVLIAGIVAAAVFAVMYRRKAKHPKVTTPVEQEAASGGYYNVASVSSNGTDEPPQCASDKKEDQVTPLYAVAQVRSKASKPTVMVKPIIKPAPTKQTEETDVDDPSLYEDTDAIARLPTGQLKKHIEKLQNGGGFQKEYSKLMQNKCHPWTVAAKSALKPKNRYRGIMAYDHSRVILDQLGDNPLSDYINANYIPNYRREKAFIASQGPTSHMVDDFWRMVWQEKITTIVMTTKLFEDEKIKCVQYWPTRDNMDFGDINVTMTEESVQSNYIVRQIKCRKGDEERTVTHFHFTSWPDHGVPKSYSPLINFWHLVRSHTQMEDAEAPVLVHCSAGIGRSGTFIAVDYLLDQAMEEQHVDVPVCVNKLRQNRVNMVQNVMQYEFLYKAVYHGIFVGKTTAAVEDFNDTAASNLISDSLLSRQFQILKDESNFSIPHDAEKSGSQGNISQTIPDEPMKLLDGTTTCAVSVQKFEKDKEMIVSEQPIPDNINIFWKLIKELNSSCIVHLQLKRKASSKWLPKPEAPLKLDNGLHIIQTQHATMSQCPHVSITELIVTDTTDEYENVAPVEVEQETGIYMNLQESKQASNGKKILLYTLEALDPKDISAVWKELQMQHTDGPIVTVCQDGVSDCGVFVGSYFLLEDLQRYQQSDVFDTVRQIRKSRPKFIKDLKQYRMLYTVGQTFAKLDK